MAIAAPLAVAAPPGPAPLARHAAETVRLALPMIGARTGLILMLTADTVMTGWAGAEELAYLAVGIAPQITLMLMAIGALQATAVLVAQAVGAGEGWRAGAKLRAGLVHALILGLAVALATPFAEDLFLALGQPAQIAAGAADVSRAFAIGLPGLLMYIVAAMFLEATGRPRVAMAIILVANVLNVPFNGVLALGWGGLVAPMGADGAVLASSVLRWLAFAAALKVILAGARGGDRFGVVAPPAAWLAAFATLGGDAGRRLRRLGLPMGIAQALESAAFTTVVFLAGSIGAATVAAYQTTMTLVVMVFMSAIGFGGAAAIRVGAAVGRGAPADVRRAGFAAIGLGVLAAVPFSVLFALFPKAMVGLVTDDATVVPAAAATLAFAAPFLAFDAANGVTAGALRGIGAVWLPLAVQVAAFWLVAVPLAWWLGVASGGGPLGLFIGIAAGMVVSAIALVACFLVVSGRPPRRA